MDTKKIKILIADDDEGIVDSLSMMLEMYGYEVSATLDGNTVVTALQDAPNLLILDTWMSGVDGREVCKEIKGNPATKNIPVLMISASREIESSALQSGADQFISKPVEMKEFLDIVAAMASQERNATGYDPAVLLPSS